jgi:hypothetical protein
MNCVFRTRLASQACYSDFKERLLVNQGRAVYRRSVPLSRGFVLPRRCPARSVLRALSPGSCLPVQAAAGLQVRPLDSALKEPRVLSKRPARTARFSTTRGRCQLFPRAAAKLAEAARLRPTPLGAQEPLRPRGPSSLVFRLGGLPWSTSGLPTDGLAGSTASQAQRLPSAPTESHFDLQTSTALVPLSLPSPVAPQGNRLPAPRPTAFHARPAPQ